MSPTICPDCHGKRLKPSSLAVRVKGMTISGLVELSIAKALATVGMELTEREAQIGGRAVEEIRNRLDFLVAVGLDYLNLARSAATLSGGEAQRIRLATQIGSKLRGVLYVLDEPSIGLHSRDNNRLLASLARLRDLGNTVLVVEHDAETIERRRLCDRSRSRRGPAGRTPGCPGHSARDRRQSRSLPGQYLAGTREISTPTHRRLPTDTPHRYSRRTEHNLKNIDVEFPWDYLSS